MVRMESGITPWPEEAMKGYRWLDECLLQQPGTERVFQPAWQAYRYLVGGKMYAYVGVNDQSGRPIITLKLEPLFSDALRQRYEDIVPGYYMNKLHWSTAYLDGAVPQAVLRDMVSAAHRVVLSSLSKRAQREIAGE